MINTFPTCARCGHSVQRITRIHPADRKFVMVFEVECHGETERTEIAIQDTSPNALMEPTIAFGRSIPA